MLEWAVLGACFYVGISPDPGLWKTLDEHTLLDPMVPVLAQGWEAPIGKILALFLQSPNAVPTGQGTFQNRRRQMCCCRRKEDINKTDTTLFAQRHDP